jgi:hypothetical protein
MLSRHLIFPALLVVLSGALCATPLRAQTATQQPPPSSTPAAAPNAQAPPADPKTPAKPAKKVWTNDDINSLSGPPDNSTPSPTMQPNSYRPRSNSGSPNANYYRNQINSLKARIADIDTKLDNYEALAHGETTGEGSKLYGTKITDSRADIQALIQQRQKLQAQISDLEDQARHAGVEPGQLR